MLSYLKKRIFAGVIKYHDMRNDLEFIRVGLKPNDKCPSKRKAEGELRQEKRGEDT